MKTDSVSIFDKVIKSGFLYLLSQIIASLVGFIVVPIYTRLFDIEDYGKFVILIANLNIMQLLCNGWLSSSILRHYTVYRNNQKGFISNVLLVLLVSIVIVSIAAFFLFGIPAICPELSLNSKILIIALFVFMSIFESMLTILRASEKNLFYSIFFITSVVSRAFLGITILLQSRKLESVFLGWLIVYFFLTILILFTVSAYSSFRKRYYSDEISSQLITYGLPFILAGLGGLGMDQLDRYMIRYYLSDSAVGIYNVCYLVSSYSIIIFFTAIMMAAYPAIVSTWEHKGRQNTTELISRLLKLFFLFSIPAFIGISLMSKEILTVLFPGPYITGYTVMPWVAGGYVVAGLIQYHQKAMVLLKKSHYFGFCYLAGVILNFALNAYLIPKKEIPGAAIATFLTYSIMLAAIMLINHFCLKLTWKVPFASLIKISIAGCIMGLFIIAARSSNLQTSSITGIAILVPAAFAVYILSLFGLRELTKSDIARAKSLFVKSD